MQILLAKNRSRKCEVHCTFLVPFVPDLLLYVVIVLTNRK